MLNIEPKGFLPSALGSIIQSPGTPTPSLPPAASGPLVARLLTLEVCKHGLPHHVLEGELFGRSLLIDRAGIQLPAYV